ncbi:unnamed protein product [Closterium sp. NIES-53]
MAVFLTRYNCVSTELLRCEALKETRPAVSPVLPKYSGRRSVRAASGVDDLQVPATWTSPEIAKQEAEWLRENLKAWLDNEYCPEPANVGISERCAKMVYDLDSFSFKESFHGPFSSANAAVALICDRASTYTSPAFPPRMADDGDWTVEENTAVEPPVAENDELFREACAFEGAAVVALVENTPNGANDGGDGGGGQGGAKTMEIMLDDGVLLTVELDSGEKRLNELGYKQDLQRDLNAFELFAVSLTGVGVFLGVIPYYDYAFASGGPVMAVWFWWITAFFAHCIALSLAEIASSFPVSCTHKAGYKAPPLLAHCIAILPCSNRASSLPITYTTRAGMPLHCLLKRLCMHIFIFASGIASPVFPSTSPSLAILLRPNPPPHPPPSLPLPHPIPLSLPPSGFLPLPPLPPLLLSSFVCPSLAYLSYSHISSCATTAGSLYFWAAALAKPKYRPLAAWITGWLEFLGASIGSGGVALGGVLAGVITIITLPLVAPTLQPAWWVFGHLDFNTANTNMPSNGYAVLVGLLMSQYALYSFDTGAHASEEAKRSDVTTPIAMVGALTLVSFLEWAVVVVLTFCIQDEATLLDGQNAAGGKPVIQILWTIFNGRSSGPSSMGGETHRTALHRTAPHRSP